MMWLNGRYYEPWQTPDVCEVPRPQHRCLSVIHGNDPECTCDDMDAELDELPLVDGCCEAPGCERERWRHE